MKMRGLSVVLMVGAVATNVAMATQYTVSGAHSIGTTGSVGPLGVNQTTGINFSSGSGNDFVSGTINAANIISTGSAGTNQVLTLVLTNFTFASTSNADITLTVNIVQDFLIDPMAVPSSARGSHQLNGIAQFDRAGQLARVKSESFHESIKLPTLNWEQTSAGPGMAVINRGQGNSTPVVLSGVYRIDATYTFTINARGGVTQIILPDSGVDNATLVLVPLPPAAIGGVGGLALLGLAQLRRTRKNA